MYRMPNPHAVSNVDSVAHSSANPYPHTRSYQDALRRMPNPHTISYASADSYPHTISNQDALHRVPDSHSLPDPHAQSAGDQAMRGVRSCGRG